MLLKLYPADFYFINVMIFIVWQMAILQADYTQEKNTARQALELYEQETSNRLNAESQLVQVQVCIGAQRALSGHWSILFSSKTIINLLLYLRQ